MKRKIDFECFVNKNDSRFKEKIYFFTRERNKIGYSKKLPPFSRSFPAKLLNTIIEKWKEVSQSELL